MMKNESTRLRRWMTEEKEFTEDEIKEMETLLCTFSEFVTAVNPDYQYNKTYLNAYAEKFIQSRSKLREKNKFLLEIVKGLMEEQVNPLEDDGIRITIDQVLCLEHGKIQIFSSFSWWDVMRSSYQYDMEYNGNDPFAIADEYQQGKENADEKLQKDLKLFAIQYKKVKRQEKKDGEQNKGTDSE